MQWITALRYVQSTDVASLSRLLAVVADKKEERAKAQHEAYLRKPLFKCPLCRWPVKKEGEIFSSLNRHLKTKHKRHAIRALEKGTKTASASVEMKDQNGTGESEWYTSTVLNPEKNLYELVPVPKEETKEDED